MFYRSYRDNAATPGSVLPSIHSRNAPPAVETNVKSSTTSAALRAAMVSPPPATATSFPVLASPAAQRATSMVPLSKGGISKTPRGPFHTRVLELTMARHRRSTVSGPASRMRSSSSIEPTWRTRAGADRTSVVQGKSVSVRVDLGGRRLIKKKNHSYQHKKLSNAPQDQ